MCHLFLDLLDLRVHDVLSQQLVGRHLGRGRLRRCSKELAQPPLAVEGYSRARDRREPHEGEREGPCEVLPDCREAMSGGAMVNLAHAGERRDFFQIGDGIVDVERKHVANSCGDQHREQHGKDVPQLPCHFEHDHSTGDGTSDAACHGSGPHESIACSEG